MCTCKIKKINVTYTQQKKAAYHRLPSIFTIGTISQVKQCEKSLYGFFSYKFTVCFIVRGYVFTVFSKYQLVLATVYSG